MNAASGGNIVVSFAHYPRKEIHLSPLQKSFIRTLAVVSLVIVSQGNRAHGQAIANNLVPPPPHAKQIHLKHVLVIGQTKGFEHDSVSPAMAAVYNMGKESGLWDTMIRTDTELLTKKDFKNNGKNVLGYFVLARV